MPFVIAIFHDSGFFLIKRIKINIKIDDFKLKNKWILENVQLFILWGKKALTNFSSRSIFFFFSKIIKLIIHAHYDVVFNNSTQSVFVPIFLDIIMSSLPREELRKFAEFRLFTRIKLLFKNLHQPSLNFCHDVTNHSHLI